MSKIKEFFNNKYIKITTKVLSWIALLFLILLATILVYYVISSKIYEIKGKKHEPFISLYTIISPSMEPNINVYDVVITKKTNANDIKEGDVITFISSSTLGEGLTITHRVKSVIKTDKDVKFRTQGDNNPIPDSALVTSENLLGKVIFKIPFLGYIQFMLQSKSGWLFALLIPAIIIVIYDVVKVIKLSNVKQRLNETLKEDEKDEDLSKKQELLKNDLKKKFNIEPQEKEVDNDKKQEDNENKVKLKEEVNNNEENEDEEKTEEEVNNNEEDEKTKEEIEIGFDLGDEIILPKKKDE